MVPCPHCGKPLPEDCRLPHERTTPVEYAVVLALIIVVCIVAVTAFNHDPNIVASAAPPLQITK